MSERTLKLSQPPLRRPFLQREPDFTMALRRASPLLLPLNQTARDLACQIFVALLPTRRVVGGADSIFSWASSLIQGRKPCIRGRGSTRGEACSSRS